MMLAQSANRCNLPIAFLDKENSPAKKFNANKYSVNGSFSSPEDMRRLARKCDILTMEIEHVDTYVLEQIEGECKAEGRKFAIQPSWETIRIIQDKYLQKAKLIENGIGVAESIPIEPAFLMQIELKRAADRLGLPFMLKARTGAYDGRGNFVVRSESDFSAALKALKGRPLYAERWANLRKS